MRHHYVPEFLLKRWAETTADKKIEAFRLDLPRIPSKRHPPKSVGFESDLYALNRNHAAGLEKQHVETKILNPVDNYAAIVLKKLLTGGLDSLTEKDNLNWVIFLISLKFRTPESVNFLKHGEPKRFKASLIENPEKNLAERIEKEDPGITDNFGMVYFGHMITETEYVIKIGDMTWGLYHFKNQKNHLLLSDKPLIFTTKSIDDPNLIIFLPLSPDKAFIATKNRQIIERFKQERPKELMTRMNENSLYDAKQRIFARDKSPHSFILNRMEKWNKHRKDAKRNQ